MMSPTLIEKFDHEKYEAMLHYDLRHNRLNSDTWEQLVAYSTNSTWVRGSAHLADAFNEDCRQCISIKTRKIEPERRKRIASRDFFNNPEHFHFNGKLPKEFDLDNLHTVTRRCSIPGLDEQASPAQDIGMTAVRDYHSYEKDSLARFKCEGTTDVVIAHGESADGKFYLSRVMFFDHSLNDINVWEDIYAGAKSKFGGSRMMILGYDDNGPHIGRVGNLGRQQTCMIRFYRKSEAMKVFEFRTPMPKSEKYDFDRERYHMAQYA